MSSNRILALSSSRAGDGGYLENALPLIKDFLGDKPLKVAFVPFASAGKNYEEYLYNVTTALWGLPYNLMLVTHDNAKEIISQSDVIMIGGGNTFKLLHDLYESDVLELIRSKVDAGTPYVGWSAGSNITGLGIGTTNDMPIIEPKSFKALGFFPFQINPHYYNQKQEGFNGETRDQRLAEFLLVNPTLPIVCLPEGTALKLDERVLKYVGDVDGVLMRANEENREISGGYDLSYLMGG